MNKPHSELVEALRETAGRLQEKQTRYEWGHMGRCNCGHLVQTVTDMTDTEIVQSVDHQLDEWSEHARDYCEGTGHRVEDIFVTLEGIGFNYKDMAHLEYLSDPKVLGRLQNRRLYRNNREDVSVYMSTLADVLEEEEKEEELVPA